MILISLCDRPILTERLRDAVRPPFALEVLLPRVMSPDAMPRRLPRPMIEGLRP